MTPGSHALMRASEPKTWQDYLRSWRRKGKRYSVTAITEPLDGTDHGGGKRRVWLNAFGEMRGRAAGGAGMPII
jgi:hypothetical protein